MLAPALLSPFLNQARNLIPFTPYCIKGLTGASHAFFIDALHQQFNKAILYIAKDENTAVKVYSDIAALDTKLRLGFFPGYNASYYSTAEPELHIIQERSEVLNTILHDPQSSIIITYPQAISITVPTQNTMQGYTFDVNAGMAVDLVFLQEWLQEYGFEYQDPVTEPGKYCVRGGLIDVFSFSSELPYRIEFNGDTVEQIRAFDPLSQLSVSKQAFMSILPNVNTSSTSTGSSVLEYFKPEHSIVIVEGFSHILLALDAYFKSETEVYEQISSHSILPAPDKALWNSRNAEKTFSSYWILDCGIQNFNASDTSHTIDLQLQPQPLFQNNFQRLSQYFLQLINQGFSIWFSALNPKQADRLSSILNDHAPQHVVLPSPWFTYMPQSLHAGYMDTTNRCAVFTDHQIFDRYHVARRSQLKTERKAGITFNELTQLQPGDYVTHIDHGVGRFAGLHKLEQQGRIQECMKILYRDQDAVYVNIQNLHRVSKYTSKEGQTPQLDKLGSQSWQHLKQKTKRKVKELAYDLIQLYAARKKTKGFAFEPDTYLQHELEASFVFEDTPDQIKVMREIKSDMELDTPMDRLLCGDVGFGKTEIAIRSAFKAVCSGKQVAILVPTTILAYQHYKTFSERLSHVPCNVEYLNRFRSAADQNLILSQLQTGKIDIIIGTHRLLGKEIQYNDLGLLIIDEEQKFGVASKDKLKLIKTQVDTLTLTATPIPRTLQFSLMGARDLSIISTPPPNRFPVQTLWHTTEDKVIKDAISFELARGGQVYVVNHRIADLEFLAQHIRILVPGARVGIGHGQMEGKALETVMLNFMEGHLDVLVSTTIVESGLDIRNANTMLIHNAQYYGLSDLHQMRGRVGRSNKKAFCYLLTPPGLTLSSDAQKRLQAIVEFSDLGSGFQIAMRDLDIRGAGNVLGAEQSGFIQEMGFDTYMKILQEAVNELHDETGLAEHIQDSGRTQFSKQLTRDVTLETDLSLYIPETYIRNAQERLNLYRELDQLRHEDELQAYMLRLNDRFGTIPDVVQELFQLIRIRWSAQRLQVDKIQFKGMLLKLYLPSPKLESYYQGKTFEAIIQYTQKHHYRCRLSEKHDRRWLEVKMVPDVNEALKIVTDIIKTN